VRKARVALDDGAGLVAIEPRHQDVAEDQFRIVVVDLGQRIEAVFGQHDFVPALAQKDLGRAADGVAVVDHQHLGAAVAGIALARGWVHSRVLPEVAGRAISQRVVAQIWTISKSSLRAPHSGQVQFIDTSAQRVPGAMPCSGSPSASL
jgi:hypothetical protein